MGLRSTIIILCAGLAIAVCNAASSSTKDKPEIPADLRFDFKPIPSDENAIVVWRRAAELQVPPEDACWLLMKYCWTPNAPLPSENDLTRLQDWLKRNRAALDVFESSLKKPKAQWFELDRRAKQPEEMALWNLMHTRLFEAEQMAEQKKFDQAVASLAGSLKLVQWAIEGDPALIHYLPAERLRQLVQSAMLRLAGRKDIPLQSLKQLLSSLPAGDHDAALYCKAVDLQFSRYAYYPVDANTLSERWMKVYKGWSEIAATNAAYKEVMEGSRLERILLDPSLISQHPNPWNQNETIEANIFHFRIAITNVLSPWDRQDRLAERMRMRVAKGLIVDAEPLTDLLKDEPFPLSQQAAKKARTAYLAIENPIGRAIESHPILSESPLDGSEMLVFMFRAELNATRAVLALLIFEKQKGVLPEKLSDLVGERILDQIPIDPFADTPLHYDRNRRIVWSVGLDGYNDNGTTDNQGYPDLVWKIPPKN